MKLFFNSSKGGLASGMVPSGLQKQCTGDGDTCLARLNKKNPASYGLGARMASI